MHDPYNDHYEYTGSFDKKRFSGQWTYHSHRAWRPWCYTHGECNANSDSGQTQTPAEAEGRGRGRCRRL